MKNRIRELELEIAKLKKEEQRREKCLGEYKEIFDHVVKNGFNAVYENETSLFDKDLGNECFAHLAFSGCEAQLHYFVKNRLIDTPEMAWNLSFPDTRKDFENFIENIPMPKKYNFSITYTTESPLWFLDEDDALTEAEYVGSTWVGYKTEITVSEVK